MKVTLLMLAALLLDASGAGAQSLSRGYAAVKFGANAERAEDGLRGTTMGGGAAAGYQWSPRWAIEAEFWAPRTLHLRRDERTHRDTSLNLGVRRSFSAGRARPHLLAGLGAMRTVDEITICSAVRPVSFSPTPVEVLVSCEEPDVTGRVRERFAGTTLAVLVGAGVVFEVTRRIHVVADVRVHPAITALMVRPAIGVGVSF